MTIVMFGGKRGRLASRRTSSHPITGLSHLFKWENLHNWWLTKHFFAPLYVPGILHNLCSSIQYIFGLTLLCSAHLNRKVDRWTFVGKFCHQSLAFSGFMVHSRQLGTSLKKTRSNHDDIIDLHVVAL